MLEQIRSAIESRAPKVARCARQAMKRFVPYKHELTAIATQLGCEARPFNCWIKIEQLKEGVERARGMAQEMAALRAAVREKDERLQVAVDSLNAADAATTARDAAQNKALVMWRALGFENRTPPEGSDLLVWLMSQLEVAEARLETERSTLNAFQASALDLLNTNERLRERIKALEGAPSAGTESGNVAA